MKNKKMKDLLINILIILLCIAIMQGIIKFSRRWLLGAFQGAGSFFDTKVTAIGVVHHELSHALFATLTGAKVDEIALFKQATEEDKSLGYVVVKYSTRPILGGIQQFFTAIAPVITALITTSLLAKLLLPNVITGEFKILEVPMMWQFWIFILLATPILYHATLSWPDIFICLKGIWVIILILWGIGMIFPGAIASLTIVMKNLVKFTALIMLIPIIIGLIIRTISR